MSSLTGRTRHRTLIERGGVLPLPKYTTLLVLQVEVTDTSDTYQGGSFWRDAMVEDLAELEELKGKKP